MSARDQILGSLPESGHTVMPPKFNWPAVPEHDLWSTFFSFFTALRGEVVEWTTLVALQGKAWCIDPGFILPDGFNPTRRGAWEADFGLTRASVAIAESGSFLLTQGSGESRLASLAPAVHVVVVSEKHIVMSLDEALMSLPDKNAVVVTGPSRTADIEGVLVNGVHGPKSVWVVVESGELQT